jgi:hypothetical protein
MLDGDWSSDVCSSDLNAIINFGDGLGDLFQARIGETQNG